MSTIFTMTAPSIFAAYNPTSVEKYDFDMSGNLMPCRANGHECPDSVLSTMFARSRTIEARLTEKSSMADLVGLVEKYAIDPKFRMLMFWAEMIEFTYVRELYDLSDLADMRYEIVKSNWSCMDILPGEPVVSHVADMRH